VKKDLVAVWRFLFGFLVCMGWRTCVGGGELAAPRGLKLLAEVARQQAIQDLEKDRLAVNRRLRRGLRRLQTSVVRYADDGGSSPCQEAAYTPEVGMLRADILIALRQAMDGQRFLDAACYQLRARSEGALLHDVMSDLGELISCERGLMAVASDADPSQPYLKRISDLLVQLAQGVRVVPGLLPAGLPQLTPHSPQVASAPRKSRPSSSTGKKSPKRRRRR